MLVQAIAAIYAHFHLLIINTLLAWGRPDPSGIDTVTMCCLLFE